MFLCIACQANPATKVKVTEAMWVRGCSDSQAANLTLAGASHDSKIKGEVSFHSKAVAAYSLLTLATAATVARLTLRTITPNQAAAPILPVGGVNAGNLPSPERKVQKYHTKKQIGLGQGRIVTRWSS
jgi:hypothetical protein